MVEDKDSYDIYSPIKFLNIFLNCYVRHWHILLLDLSLGVSLQVQYEKDFSDIKLSIFYLPSPSPAYASVSFEKKLNEYKRVLL